MQDEENKDENKSVESETEEFNVSRVYEVGYLLLPTIDEENIGVLYGDLKELVSSFGGGVISSDMPKMTELAYTMTKVIGNIRTKFNSAYFGWIKFEMDSQKVLEFKKRLRLDQNIIRFLILKTVKENTIAGKKFVHREGGYHKVPVVKKEKTIEEAVPINKEEIDKEIEALVS